MNERIYAVWLSAAEKLTSMERCRLHRIFGSAKNVCEAGEKEWREALGEEKALYLRSLKRSLPLTEIEEKAGRWSEEGLSFCHLFEKGYPSLLAQIPDPPYMLFYKGRLPDAETPAAAVVGSRQCSPYGAHVAEELGRTLAARGFSVISGMASGIDGIAQEAAVNAGGYSLGVFGCGVDVCYPKKHRKLYDRLVETGGIVSEFIPGTHPMPQWFPMRNRIISGLSQAVVVVEARKRSGSLITADQALDQGRDVFVVPGRITDVFCQGCLSLVRQGADVVVSVDGFVRELEEKYFYRDGLPGDPVPESEKKNLACDEELVYSCLDFSPKDISRLRSEAGLSDRQTVRILTELELKEMARQVSRGYFTRR